MQNCTTENHDAQADACGTGTSDQPSPGIEMPDPASLGEDLTAGDSTKRANHKDLLLAAATGAELWHDPDDDAFASVIVKGKREHVKVRSKAFRNWLCFQVYSTCGVSPGGQQLEEVLRILEAKARYQGAEHLTHVRVAGDAQTSYLHLADDAGTVVRTDAQGVSVASDAQIKFLTKPGMRPLPMPMVPRDSMQAAEWIRELRKFCNVKDAAEWLLFLVTLLSAFRSSGPFVVVIVVGEQGSAKSTTCKVFRRLIDPSKAPLRSAPREERDLWIAAINGWLVIFDNVSKIPAALSDQICRLATGGGNSYRTLYEDDSETLFEAQRLVIINSIDDLTLRGDLIDRAIQVTCRKIPDSDRIPEQQFWADFEKLEGRFLGTLLYLLSLTLKELPDVRLKDSPRMADYARFGVAVERALGLQHGTFLDAYNVNRKALTAVALENPFNQLILDLQKPVGMTPTQLWAQLRKLASLDNQPLPRWFPINAQQLSSFLRRSAPFFRHQGIEIDFGKSGSRSINISNKPGVATP